MGVWIEVSSASSWEFRGRGSWHGLWTVFKDITPLWGDSFGEGNAVLYAYVVASVYESFPHEPKRPSPCLIYLPQGDERVSLSRPNAGRWGGGGGCFELIFLFPVRVHPIHRTPIWGTISLWIAWFCNISWLIFEPREVIFSAFFRFSQIRWTNFSESKKFETRSEKNRFK